MLVFFLNHTQSELSVLQAQHSDYELSICFGVVGEGMQRVATPLQTFRVWKFAFFLHGPIQDDVGIIDHYLKHFLSLHRFMEINVFALFDLALYFFIERHVLDGLLCVGSSAAEVEIASNFLYSSNLKGAALFGRTVGLGQI